MKSTGVLTTIETFGSISLTDRTCAARVRQHCFVKQIKKTRELFERLSM